MFEKRTEPFEVHFFELPGKISLKLFLTHNIDFKDSEFLKGLLMVNRECHLNCSMDIHGRLRCSHIFYADEEVENIWETIQNRMENFAQIAAKQEEGQNE